MDSAKIKAPFDKRQIKQLNEFQKEGKFHPFTCCSPEDIPECLRAVKEVDGKIVNGPSDGLLIATEEGWVCPCGKYKQDWAYSFMVREESYFDRLKEHPGLGWGVMMPILGFLAGASNKHIESWYVGGLFGMLFCSVFVWTIILISNRK